MPQISGKCNPFPIPYAINGGIIFNQLCSLLKSYPANIQSSAAIFTLSFDSITPFGTPVVPPVWTITAAFSWLYGASIAFAFLLLSINSDHLVKLKLFVNRSSSFLLGSFIASKNIFAAYPKLIPNGIESAGEIWTTSLTEVFSFISLNFGAATSIVNNNVLCTSSA